MKTVSAREELIVYVFNPDSDNEFPLKVGDEVLIITDETDFEKEYSGRIELITEDGVELENSDYIYWDYIVHVEKIM